MNSESSAPGLAGNAMQALGSVMLTKLLEESLTLVFARMVREMQVKIVHKLMDSNGHGSKLRTMRCRSDCTTMSLT